MDPLHDAAEHQVSLGLEGTASGDGGTQALEGRIVPGGDPHGPRDGEQAGGVVGAVQEERDVARPGVGQIASDDEIADAIALETVSRG